MCYSLEMVASATMQVVDDADEETFSTTACLSVEVKLTSDTTIAPVTSCFVSFPRALRSRGIVIATAKNSQISVSSKLPASSGVLS